MMFFAAVPHISVKADEVFSIAGWPITNANLVGLLGLIGEFCNSLDCLVL